MSNGETVAYGCFYGIGVGPGDPELLTLKALRVLRQVQVICVPLSDTSEESYVFNIVKGFLEKDKGQEILEYAFPSDRAEEAPMVWAEAARDIVERLRNGKDVAFITEGDPVVYSTFSFVMDSVRAACPEAEVEIIPGVSSVMAAAARAGVALVTEGQRLAILPAVYGIDDLRHAITHNDTIVLMEANRNLLSALANLEKLGLLGRAIYVRRATTPQERVARDIHQITDEDLDYFSLVIIHKDN